MNLMIARGAYERGYRDGFVDATITDETGFPDESVTLKRVSNVNVAEGWGIHEDSVLAELRAMRDQIARLANEWRTDRADGSVLADRILALFGDAA